MEDEPLAGMCARRRMVAGYSPGRRVLAGSSPRRGEPGFAPAGDSLFFASPKKSKQKKGDPAVCDPAAVAAGQPASDGYSRGSAQTRYAQTVRGPVPATAMFRRRIQKGGSELPWRAQKVGSTPSICAEVSPLAPLGVPAVPSQSGGEDGRVFERSEFAAVPHAVGQSQGHPPQAGHGQWGRFFFAYFLLATQKKVGAPPGAYPGSHRPAGASSRLRSLTC